MMEITRKYLRATSPRVKKERKLFIGRSGNYKVRLSSDLVEEMGIDHTSYLRIFIENGSVICQKSNSPEGFSLNSTGYDTAYVSERLLIEWLEQNVGLYSGSRCQLVAHPANDGRYFILKAVKKPETKTKQNNDTHKN